tara:strand:+ start:261 stop:674 length:414 start_codon:yes stop_codon:yes gene_type:complete
MAAISRRLVQYSPDGFCVSMIRSVGVAALFAVAVSGCSFLDVNTFSLPGDYKKLADYGEFGFSLTKELNEGEWDDGAKVTFSNPHDCGSHNGYYNCDFMAVIEDVRGRQGCVNLNGRKVLGNIKYDSDSETACRWLH